MSTHHQFRETRSSHGEPLIVQCSSMFGNGADHGQDVQGGGHIYTLGHSDGHGVFD